MEMNEFHPGEKGHRKRYLVSANCGRGQDRRLWVFCNVKETMLMKYVKILLGLAAGRRGGGHRFRVCLGFWWVLD